MPDVDITIANVVLAGFFSENVDLDVACSKLEGSRNRWQRFPGLVYKSSFPAATFLLFRNGKYICTGVRTEKKGQEAMDYFLKLLQDKNLVSSRCTYTSRVTNLTASITIINHSVSLIRFAERFDRVVYNQDIFPAAVCTLPNSNVTFLVFPAGKLICSGIRDKTVLENTVYDFCNQLAEKNTLVRLVR